MKPSNFLNYPFSSVFEKAENETIARNIMVILSKSGDKFRKLGWKEYKQAREKDGAFSFMEKVYFDQVVNYCTSAKKAKTFSKEWNKHVMEHKDYLDNSKHLA